MSLLDEDLILVAGGDRDPNLRALVTTLEGRGRDVLFLQVGASHHPWISWHLDSDRLILDGREIRPCAAFVRYDVFTHQADGRPATADRAQSWYTAIASWLAAHSEVRTLNRAGRFHDIHKPTVLHLAREVGLDIPDTLVSNHLAGVDDFRPGEPKIAKPINGGGYCRRLDEVLGEVECRRRGVAAAPAIIQPELVQPEFRVYRIADAFLGFAVVSRELDYRTTQDCQLEPWSEMPPELTAGLGRLMDRLGLDFGAADFKTCPKTGRLLLLEVNTGPMFAAFDRASDGAVTAAIASFLEGEPSESWDETPVGLDSIPASATEATYGCTESRASP